MSTPKGCCEMLPHAAPATSGLLRVAAWGFKLLLLRIILI